MDWQRLLDDSRPAKPERVGARLGRSEFQKDHDRLIFSEPFRMLGRKTQVHPLPRNDKVHNRLTHSLEVSCVGRSLGELVGRELEARGELPPRVQTADIGAIVQAACLAHDIGNPPFGHAGEYAIRDWYSRQPASFFDGFSAHCVQDLCTFEGNAQGFRMLTSLHDIVGIRLTSATLATFVKYPWCSTAPAAAARHGKYSCYESEFRLMRDIFDAMGIPEVASGVYARHPLAYLVEAADDICYAIVDIEDGMEMEILRPAEVIAVFTDLLDDDLRAEFHAGRTGHGERQRIRWLRGKAIDGLVAECTAIFFAQYDAILAGEFAGTLVEAGPARLRDGIAQAKQLARDEIFRHSRKTEVEIGAYSAVATLLATCSEAAREQVASSSPASLSYRSNRILQLMEDQAPSHGFGIEEHYRRINDFVSALTDNQVTRLAQFARGNPIDG
ncbi:deoxyguanosinetriphosphate triphosphohydrolase [Lichenicoccus roseus]|uniref:Deoxyguanosinetriphosphate triphosphohydrolase n=1 Tax=Lichenicoccus roseus TaxID=2683649 RepID=A0A5R9J5S9_9PROT|nr:deoxyguanosinetriphosphate triphosphohydrolase [Lichenicoccus roseus]TLU72970.1 deoxyguanosinetriphosphate triphosphohydrolase [Lichenicoccus roseus]